MLYHYIFSPIKVAVNYLVSEPEYNLWLNVNTKEQMNGFDFKYFELILNEATVKQVTLNERK